MHLKILKTGATRRPTIWGVKRVTHPDVEGGAVELLGLLARLVARAHSSVGAGGDTSVKGPSAAAAAVSGAPPASADGPWIGATECGANRDSITTG